MSRSPTHDSKLDLVEVTCVTLFFSFNHHSMTFSFTETSFLLKKTKNKTIWLILLAGNMEQQRHAMYREIMWDRIWPFGPTKTLVKSTKQGKSTQFYFFLSL